MKTRSAVFATALGLAFAGAASAQVISYSPRTGDIWVDSQLNSYNDYGRGNRDYFVDDVVNNFGAPRYLVNDLLTTRKFSPGDVYYACAIAYQTHRPCGDVARDYETNRGQGWGVVAMRMGIKPGSAEFHALKDQMGKSNGRFKSHGNSGAHGNAGNSGRGDGSEQRGKSDQHGKSDKHGDRGYGDEHGDSGNDQGERGKGKDKGNGKGKDKGKGH